LLFERYAYYTRRNSVARTSPLVTQKGCAELPRALYYFIGLARPQGSAHHRSL